MDIIESATQLGVAIAESDQLKNYRESEIAMTSDAKAQTLMEEYKNLQLDMVKAAKAELSKEELTAIRGLLMDKQAELNSYDITNNYFEGRKAFEGIMKNINEVLQYYVNGQQSSCNDEGDCGSGGCSSCSGCK